MEHERAGGAGDDRSKLRSALLFAVLCVVGLLVWGGALRNGFVWDDEYFVVSNLALRDLANIPSYFTELATMAGRGYSERFAVFRPMRNVSYALDFQIAGLAPAWWHAHNLILHFLGSWLVFTILRRLKLSLYAAAFGALIFLVHPAQSEAVVWVKGRDDVLGTLWLLAGFQAWLMWRERLSPARIAGLCGFYLVACLAKDQCVVLPALLLADEAWTHPRGGSWSGLARRLLPALVALGATGVGYLAWRHHFIGRSSQCDYLAGSFLPTMMTMNQAGVDYLKLLVWPAKLLADYSGMEPIRTAADPRLWLNLAVLASVAVAVLFARRRAPVASFGFLWFFIAMLPMANIVPMMQYMAERFMYLPLAGFAFAVAGLATWLEQRHSRIMVFVLIVTVGACGVRSADRVKDWKDNDTLYAVTVRDTPPQALRPRLNLMYFQMNRGEYAQALPLARDLKERYDADPARTPRERAEITRHLGVMLMNTGEGGRGRALLEQAIATDPSYVKPYLDLGVAEGMAERHEEALGWFERAVAANPAQPDAHYNLGIAQLSLGEKVRALQEFQQAIDLGYESSGAHLSLAAILWQDGRVDEALQLYADGLRIWPDDAELRRWQAAARAALVPVEKNVDPHQVSPH